MDSEERQGISAGKPATITKIEINGRDGDARFEYAIAKEMNLEIMYQTCNANISKAEI